MLVIKTNWTEVFVGEIKEENKDQPSALKWH